MCGRSSGGRSAAGCSRGSPPIARSTCCGRSGGWRPESWGCRRSSRPSTGRKITPCPQSAVHAQAGRYRSACPSGRSSSGWGRETLTLLCGYLDPQPAAAAAARILVGHQARLLTLNDLAADAASIRTTEGTISIPEAARILFLAHLELRRSEGADTIAPLIRVRDHLRNDYADRHLNEHQWRDLLQSIEVDTGLSGLSPREPLRPDPRWNRSSGFSLTPLNQRKAA